MSTDYEVGGTYDHDGVECEITSVESTVDGNNTTVTVIIGKPVTEGE